MDKKLVMFKNFGIRKEFTMKNTVEKCGTTLAELFRENAAGLNGKAVTNTDDWYIPVDGYIHENLVNLYQDTKGEIFYHGYNVLSMNFLRDMFAIWNDVKELTATNRLMFWLLDADTWRKPGECPMNNTEEKHGTRLAELFRENAAGLNGKAVSNTDDWYIPVDGYIHENLVNLFQNSNGKIDYRSHKVLHLYFFVDMFAVWDDVKELTATSRLMFWLLDADTWCKKGV